MKKNKRNILIVLGMMLAAIFITIFSISNFSNKRQTFEGGKKTQMNESLSRSYKKPGKFARTRDANLTVTEGNSSEMQTGEMERKIVYRADIGMEIKNFDEAANNITTLAKELKGFILNANKNLNEQDIASGGIVAKIPPQNFDLFIQRIEKFGKLKNKNVSSRDITEQYIDLNARLKTSGELERRLLKILQIKTKKLKDVLEVERELARVREKIEQMEGRIRYLNSQTELAEISIFLYEPDKITTKGYDFLKRLRLAFRNAVNLFISITVSLITLAGIILGLGIYFALGYFAYTLLKKSKK